MISAFTVYLVMQADAIGFSSCFAGCCFGLIGALLWLFGMDYENEKQEKIGRALAIFGVLTFVAGVLIPSTKTATAMLIVPAITSGEVIEMATPEARELYDLAKGALKSFGADKCPKEVEK